MEELKEEVSVKENFRRKLVRSWLKLQTWTEWTETVNKESR